MSRKKKILAILALIGLLPLVIFGIVVVSQFAIIRFAQETSVLPLATLIHNDFDHLETLPQCRYLLGDENYMSETEEKVLYCEQNTIDLDFIGKGVRPDYLIVSTEEACTDTPESLSRQENAFFIGFPLYFLDYAIIRDNLRDRSETYKYYLEYGSNILNTSVIIYCKENRVRYIITNRDFQAYNYGVDYEEIDTYLYSVGGYDIEPH